MQRNPPEAKNAFSRFLGFWTEERSLSVMLVFLLLHIFFLTPARFLGNIFQIFGIVFLFLALAAGLITMVESRMLRMMGTVIVTGLVLFKSAAFFLGVRWVVVGDTLFTLLSLSALICIVYRQISAEGPVSAHRIRGAIAEYLLIAILFAFLYGLIEELAPGSLIIPESWTVSPVAHGEAYYYFSIITLTTVGFGDITPVHPFVRSLVMLEALLGQLYPAILIARLVTLELETRRSRTGGS